MSIRNIFTRSIARENGRAIRRLTQRVTNSTREFWRQFLLQFGDASFRWCCASLHPEIPPNKTQISPSRPLITLGYWEGDVRDWAGRRRRASTWVRVGYAYPNLDFGMLFLLLLFVACACGSCLHSENDGSSLAFSGCGISMRHWSH